MASTRCRRSSPILAFAVGLLLPLLLLVSATTAQTSSFNPSTYDHTFTLAAAGNLKFHWKIDKTANEIHLAIQAHTSGWIGFGLAEPSSGSMPGSDMMVAKVVNNQLVVTDHYATSYLAPEQDCNNVSDWKAVRSFQGADATNGGKILTTVEVTRALQAVDTYNDRSILDDGIPHRLIFAFGTSNYFAHHGPNAAIASVNLFSPTDITFESVKAEPTTERLELRMGSVTIPTRETTYTYSNCVQTPSSANLGTPYLVAFEPVITPGNAKYVHHYVITGYDNVDCLGIGSMLYGVGSYHVGFAFPADVGVDMTQFKAYNFQMHYDNRWLDIGVVDNSGIDFLFTRTPRTHNAGVLQTGDPFVQTSGDIALGLSSYTYQCGGTCTQNWGKDMTVFADGLHMHETGVKMDSIVIAPDGSIKQKEEAEYYAFHIQQARLLERFTVKRGDAIRTTCVYNTSTRTRFGLGSLEEMCIHFLYYYPYEPVLNKRYCGVSSCGMQLGQQELSSDADLYRHFGTACAEQGKAPRATTDPYATQAPSGESSAVRSGSSVGVLAVLLTLGAIML